MGFQRLLNLCLNSCSICLNSYVHNHKNHVFFVPNWYGITELWVLGAKFAPTDSVDQKLYGLLEVNKHLNGL